MTAKSSYPRTSILSILNEFSANHNLLHQSRPTSECKYTEFGLSNSSGFNVNSSGFNINRNGDRLFVSTENASQYKYYGDYNGERNNMKPLNLGENMLCSELSSSSTNTTTKYVRYLSDSHPNSYSSNCKLNPSRNNIKLLISNVQQMKIINNINKPQRICNYFSLNHEVAHVNNADNNRPNQNHDNIQYNNATLNNLNTSKNNIKNLKINKKRSRIEGEDKDNIFCNERNAKKRRIELNVVYTQHNKVVKENMDIDGESGDSDDDIDILYNNCDTNNSSLTSLTLNTSEYIYPFVTTLDSDYKISQNNDNKNELKCIYSQRSTMNFSL